MLNEYFIAAIFEKLGKLHIAKKLTQIQTLRSKSLGSSENYTKKN